MNINLDKNLENFLQIIAKNALIQKVRVFFVGGIVRDFVLETINNKTKFETLNLQTFKDIDLIIEGNAIDFINSINKTPTVKIISTHKDFATVKVQYNPENQPAQNKLNKASTPFLIDIASTRSEKYPHSGCLPELIDVGIKIEKDVKRRDFSVNSLYLEIKFNPETSKLDFEIIDLVDGINDIKQKTLRVLHKKSYIDDPTRILRGLDFKYRFNFDFSDDDKKLIDEYLKKIEYNNSSKDRIKNVFLKVLSSDNARKIFQDIIDKKLYKILFKDNTTCDIKKTNKIIELFKNYYSNIIDKKIISKFYFSILENNKIEKLNFKNKLEICHIFSKFTLKELMYYFYQTDDENILAFLKIKDIKLLIKGKDLIKLGFSQGKIIGEILDKILMEKFENPEFFKTKEDEIKKVEEFYNN